MDSNDFVNWFGETIGGTSDTGWSDEDELDSLWNQYNDLVEELKADGYKVLRNQNGKHKIIKGD